MKIFGCNGWMDGMILWVEWMLIVDVECGC